jgi:hypothetical protein
MWDYQQLVGNPKRVSWIVLMDPGKVKEAKVVLGQPGM